jgi:hypothetical protein
MDFSGTSPYLRLCSVPLFFLTSSVYLVSSIFATRRFIPVTCIRIVFRVDEEMVGLFPGMPFRLDVGKDL